MKIHRLEDGDLLKILPFVGENGEETFIVDYQSIYLSNQQIMLYDNTGILKKIYFNDKKSGKHNFKLSNKSFINVSINGEIKTIIISRTIRGIIEANQKLLDTNENFFLTIRKQATYSSIGVLPSYENSHVTKSFWEPLSEKFIRDNQGDYSSLLKKKSVMNNRNYITKEFGTDLVGEFLSENRNKKINEILN